MIPTPIFPITNKHSRIHLGRISMKSFSHCGTRPLNDCLCKATCMLFLPEKILIPFLLVVMFWFRIHSVPVIMDIISGKGWLQIFFIGALPYSMSWLPVYFWMGNMFIEKRPVPFLRVIY